MRLIDFETIISRAFANLLDELIMHGFQELACDSRIEDAFYRNLKLDVDKGIYVPDVIEIIAWAYENNIINEEENESFAVNYIKGN